MQRKSVSARGGYRDRRAFGAIEVIVIVLIVAVIGLMIVTALPRQREAARTAACQRNLMQIGMALALYHQADGRLPAVPPSDEGPAGGHPSPLGAMLLQLGVPNFLGLADREDRPAKQADAAPDERPVPGFTCPSDLNATAAALPAPVSYRATAGDRPEGANGPFAPGRAAFVADIESGDGLAYTAGFAERLVGDDRKIRAPNNYALVPGPIGPWGCPDAPETAWRGDAGSSWVSPDWKSTLYNHALTPGGSPSCIATDGRSARMGASSAHVGRVHVLLLDGSVRPYTPQVDPKVWRGLANTDDRAAIPKQTPGPREVVTDPVGPD